MFNFLKIFQNNKTAIGIDISDSSVKLLSLEKDKQGKLSTESFEYLTIEEGIVENGKLLNKEKISQILADALKKTSSQPSQAILALPESKAFIDIYEVDSSLKGNALKDKLVQLAGKNIPFEPAKTYFDFKEISVDKEKSKKNFIYIASPKETVDNYLDVCQDIGLKIAAIEVESLSLKRSLLEKEDYKKSILLLDLGSRTINMSVTYQGNIYLSSVVPKGGNQLTKEIADATRLSFEEADRLKMSMGVQEKSDKKDKVAQILTSFCDPVIQEIKEQINFYTKQTGREMTECIICGGSSLMTGIDACLEEKLSLKVRRVDPWKKHRIAITSENGKMYLEKEAPLLYATVIGLALRGIQDNPRTSDLNLLHSKGR